MPHKILVIEDQSSVRTLLTDYLVANGYEVECAANGVLGLAAARRGQPDLILLDVMMPEMDGFEFLRRFRQERATPVIALTALMEETDRVVGLELGADDYITKPFSMRELVARIRAVLRRTEGSAGPAEVVRVGEVMLDRQRHLVEVAGRAVSLTPTEFDLLATLMAAPGRVFSRAQLLERLQGYGWEGIERTVDVHVRNLRTKLEPDPKQPRFVETVFGVGYRFAAPGSE